MRVLLPLGLVAGLVLAGCIEQAPLEAANVQAPGATTLDPARVVAHALDELVELPEGWADVQVRLATTGENGAEPTLGVTSDGTLFTTSGGTRIARSVDHGHTWQILETGDPLMRPKTNLDPWIWVDPLTDRVFHAPLYVVCTWLAWSDDKGDSWETNPLAGCGVPAHDHQKLTTGPPAPGVKTDGYANVVYYSYNSFRGEGTWITTSLDGGKTFGLGQVVHPDDPCQGGVAGPVAVGPNGTAYSPKPTCEGISLAVSKDSGQTWSGPTLVTDAGMDRMLASMTDAAVDAAGNAYAVWVGEDGGVYLTSTTDEGASWSKPKRVSPPGVNATIFPTVAAGEAGRVVVGYLGTRADASGWPTRSGQDAAPTARWHLYLSFADDAAAETPTFVSIQATPDDDPVQIGCIWQSGGSSACRNMADFFDLVERDGRAYLVFADGCKKCVSPDRSRGSEVTVAIVERGPSLRGDVALVPLPGL